MPCRSGERPSLQLASDAPGWQPAPSAGTPHRPRPTGTAGAVADAATQLPTDTIVVITADLVGVHVYLCHRSLPTWKIGVIRPVRALAGHVASEGPKTVEGLDRRKSRDHGQRRRSWKKRRAVYRLHEGAYGSSIVGAPGFVNRLCRVVRRRRPVRHAARRQARWALSSRRRPRRDGGRSPESAQSIAPPKVARAHPAERLRDCTRLPPRRSGAAHHAPKRGRVASRCSAGPGPRVSSAG